MYIYIYIICMYIHIYIYIYIYTCMIMSARQTHGMYTRCACYGALRRDVASRFDHAVVRSMQNVDRCSARCISFMACVPRLSFVAL